MENKKLALSAPYDESSSETTIDFTGLPDRFSGKPDSISVDVWTFTFKNVCKIKKWSDKTSKDVFKIWVKGDAAGWVLQQETFEKDSEEKSLDQWFLLLKNKFSRRFIQKKQKITSIRPLVNLTPKRNEQVNGFNYRFMEVLDLIVPEIVHSATIKSIYLEAIIEIDSELSWILSNETDFSKYNIDELLKEANKMYLKRKKYSNETTKPTLQNPKKEDTDTSLVELTKKFSRIALVLEEKEKKEYTTVKCFSCNNIGHISTNCPNKNSPYKDRSYSRNNYYSKENTPNSAPSENKNLYSEKKDVMLFEKTA
ncbi:hypothetical protein AYI70_g4351 [Smittium culicis]|uniref:CCHC-type domain-containing protein n=1 Tax=Smittium culicis TaxID=133412 RepID=A0A1R1XZL6_9FUNG|nr:hypothetical protein AYI70_g4351 [Smittium culicis]